MIDRDLDGKIALVTGSSRGIGKEIAVHLAQRGANIVVHYFRQKGAAEKTVEEIRALGVRAIAIKAHLKNQEAIEALFTSVQEEFQDLDILVCNAASGVFGSSMNIKSHDWDWTMNINTRSVLWCVQQARPMMKRRGGGHVVAIGSIGTERMIKDYSMVGISKGALKSLVQYLAIELAPENIFVNAVTPGVIETDALAVYEKRRENDETVDTRSMSEKALKRTPTGRLVQANEVANLVAFLCSSSGIVGQSIIVDNGFGLTW